MYTITERQSRCLEKLQEAAAPEERDNEEDGPGRSKAQRVRERRPGVEDACGVFYPHNICATFQAWQFLHAHRQEMPRINTAAMPCTAVRGGRPLEFLTLNLGFHSEHASSIDGNTISIYNNSIKVQMVFYKRCPVACVQI